MCKLFGSCVVSPSKTQKKRVKKNHTSAYFLLEHKYIHFLKKWVFFRYFLENYWIYTTWVAASLMNIRDAPFSKPPYPAQEMVWEAERQSWNPQKVMALILHFCLETVPFFQFISAIASTSSAPILHLDPQRFDFPLLWSRSLHLIG